MKKIDLSIVIPVYNEEENILQLLDEITTVTTKMQTSYEIIVIDDGSTDKTLDKVKSSTKKINTLKIISFRKNFGQTAALKAGFDHSKGSVIVTLDGDLQNNPVDIPRLVKKLNQGYDVVSGWRKKRNDNYLLRKFPSFWANKLISKISGVSLHDYGCTLKAYRKVITDEINLYGEMHRFIPVVAAGVGAKIVEIEVSHRPRIHGTSKYSITRIFKVILDLLTVTFITSFQTRPIHFFGGFGLILFFGGSSLFGWLALERIFNLTRLSDRPLFLVSIFLMLVGVQLITLGLLVEVLIRVYYESQNKKTYVIKEEITY